MSSNSPPSDLRQASEARIGRLLGRSYRKWRRYMDGAFRDFGLTEAARGPLVALYDQNRPMRQVELAEVLGLDPSALVRVIPLLEERGLIATTPDPEDRRSKLIALTEEGAAWSERILAKSLEIESRFLAALSPEEVEVTRRVLGQVLRSIPDG